MQTTLQQPKKTGGWQYFVKSKYVTAFTDWLLGFGTKSAEVILIFTTLYMSAELYPGIHFPGWLNLAVLIIQMFALDMGAIGMGTLIRRAQKEGVTDGIAFAKKFRNFLTGLMIAGIVTVALNQTIGFLAIQDQTLLGRINATEVVISLILVVCRIFGAVMYGKVIRDLEADTPISSADEKNELQSLRDELNMIIQSYSILPEKIAQIELQFAEKLNMVSTTFNTQIEYSKGASTSEIEHSLNVQFEQKLSEIEHSLNVQLEQKLKAFRAFIEAKSVSIQEVPPSPDPARQPLQLQQKREARNQTASPVMGKEEFVHDCMKRGYTTGPSIEKRAQELNFDISVGSIHNYRKTFKLNIQSEGDTGEMNAV